MLVDDLKSACELFMSLDHEWFPTTSHKDRQLSLLLHITKVKRTNWLVHILRSQYFFVDDQGRLGESYE